MEHTCKRLGNKLSKKLNVLHGSLGIPLYRDDLNAHQDKLTIGESEIDFDLNGKIVVLVDNVLFTGRTGRVAIGQILDLGRPSLIYLVVRVDRGQRELPICPTTIGKRVKTQRENSVEVKLKEIDGIDEAYVLSP